MSHTVTFNCFLSQFHWQYYIWNFLKKKKDAFFILSWSDLIARIAFCGLPNKKVSNVVFFRQRMTFNSPEFTVGFTVIHLFYVSTNNDMSGTTDESYTFGDAFSDPSGHLILFSLNRLHKQSFPSRAEIRAKEIPQTP